MKFTLNIVDYPNRTLSFARLFLIPKLAAYDCRAGWQSIEFGTALSIKNIYSGPSKSTLLRRSRHADNALDA